MIKNTIVLLICFLFTQKTWADYELTGAQNAEMLAMAKAVNHSSMAYHATVMQKMLIEANFAAERLKLPTHYPIKMSDLTDNFVGLPWFRVLHGTNRFPDTIYGAHIFDPDIPQEARLRALKLGIGGYMTTTNFEFGFDKGRLCRVTRISKPNVEYYAHDLDKLVGKPSLIDTDGAHQLAMKWLTAIDMDVTALEKLKWTVNQLHYLARGATNAVALPLYYVDIGSKHYPASGNLKAFDESLISVEILGSTKELQNLEIHDLSYSLRPQLLITNVFELVNTPGKSMQLNKGN